MTGADPPPRPTVEVWFARDSVPEVERFTCDNARGKIHRSGSSETKAGCVSLGGGRDAAGRRVVWKLYADVKTIAMYLPEEGDGDGTG